MKKSTPALLRAIILSAALFSLTGCSSFTVTPSSQPYTHDQEETSQAQTNVVRYEVSDVDTSKEQPTGSVTITIPDLKTIYEKVKAESAEDITQEQFLDEMSKYLDSCTITETVRVNVEEKDGTWQPVSQDEIRKIVYQEAHDFMVDAFLSTEWNDIQVDLREVAE